MPLELERFRIRKVEMTEIMLIEIYYHFLGNSLEQNTGGKTGQGGSVMCDRT